jgi:hypothetical protein
MGLTDMIKVAAVPNEAAILVGSEYLGMTHADDGERN